MDLGRLRFGDWVMGLGGAAALAVMFVDWYEVVLPEAQAGAYAPLGDLSFNAWESFAVTDLVLAVASLMALTAVALTAAQPTAAAPLALASLTTVVALTALVLVLVRLIWPPGLGDAGVFDTGRLTGAWLGLVAATALAAGCLASIRDERLPKPEHPVEPRLVEP